MFCPNCRKEVEVDAKFCGYCGAELPKKRGVTVIDTKEKKEEQISAEKIKKAGGPKEVGTGRKIVAGIVLVFLVLFALILIFEIIEIAVKGGGIPELAGAFVTAFLVVALYAAFRALLKR